MIATNAPCISCIQLHVALLFTRGIVLSTLHHYLLLINTLRPRQHGRHFADDTFKRIFFNENVWISIKISLKFVSKGPINNIPALVKIMAWRRSGDKPLSEPMMVSLPTHICVTRPQWVNKVIHSNCTTNIATVCAIPMHLKHSIMESACHHSLFPSHGSIFMYIIPSNMHMVCCGFFSTAVDV